MSMKVTVFDVEHGFCAFIRTPTKHTALIDCGCTDKFSPALYVSENELGDTLRWDNFKLTRMTVTHPHDDHIEDITTVKEYCAPAILLCQQYEWEDVKTSEEGDYDNLDTYSGWQETYSEPVTVLPDYGMLLQTFYLSPDEAKKVDEAKYINNSSMVTVATVQGTLHQEKFLFGGDMETAGWDALLKANKYFKAAVKDVDFFIVSHHGHSSGFSEELYKAMGQKPLVNIVSIHHNDEHIEARYSLEDYASGVPQSATKGIEFNGASLRRMLTTRKDGSITVHISDEGKYFIEGAHLADNRKQKAAKGWMW